MLLLQIIHEVTNWAETGQTPSTGHTAIHHYPLFKVSTAIQLTLLYSIQVHQLFLRGNNQELKQMCYSTRKEELNPYASQKIIFKMMAHLKFPIWNSSIILLSVTYAEKNNLSK